MRNISASATGVCDWYGSAGAGGAHEELNELAVTTPQAASATIAAHQDAFARHQLTDIWPRITGLVVQRGWNLIIIMLLITARKSPRPE